MPHLRVSVDCGATSRISLRSEATDSYAPGDTRQITTFDCKFTRPLILPARVGLYVEDHNVYVGYAPAGLWGSSLDGTAVCWVCGITGPLPENQHTAPTAKPLAADPRPRAAASPPLSPCNADLAS